MKTTTPFIFDNHDIERFIVSDLKLLSDIKKSFDYIYGKLLATGNALLCVATDTDYNLESREWSEGKNYKWLAIGCDGQVKMLIRSYGGHHMVFCKNTTTRKYREETYQEFRYSAFTFNTCTDHLSDDESDFYCENSYHDLQNAMSQIILMVTENKINSVWNSHSLTRPRHVEVKPVYDAEQLYSIDQLIFCAEELSNKHMELFAEQDMLAMLKSLPDVVGQDFDRGVIKSVKTEFPKQYQDPYYHGVGIEVKETDGRIKFVDVYTLSRYCLEDVQKLMSV